MAKTHKPGSLREALKYLSDSPRCLEVARGLRWPGGVRCPNCGSEEVLFLETRQVWKCKRDHPGRQFSIKVGTIFEDSPIALDKWLGAIWMVANRPEDTTASILTRTLEVTPKTAWFMLHRIRLAMNTGAFEKLAYRRQRASRANVIRIPPRRTHRHEITAQ